MEPGLPSFSRRRSGTIRSFVRSWRRSGRMRFWWWPTGGSFRSGCWSCRGLGNFNLHGSLLPKYRGAAPIQWAVANGESGDRSDDDAPGRGWTREICCWQREWRLAPDRRRRMLFPVLAEMGADLMMETLRRAGVRAPLTPRKQDHARATLAPILTREDGRMDFTQPSMTLYNRWRGFQPWPGAWSTLGGKKLTVHRLLPTELRGARRMEPGQLLAEQGTLFVACGQRQLAGTGGSPDGRQAADDGGGVSAWARDEKRGRGWTDQGTGHRAQGTGHRA